MKKFVVCFLVVIITLFSVSCSKEEKELRAKTELFLGKRNNFRNDFGMIFLEAT